MRRSALAFARSLCGQRGLQALVQSKEVLDAFALGREARTAVETVDGAIQRVMCSSEIRRHQVGVLEIGQRRVWVSSAGVEHGLRQRLHCRHFRILALETGRYRESVVNDTDRVAVAALKPPADVA